MDRQILDVDDSPRANRAGRYRELAVALRSLAPQLKNADARKELHEIAEHYERLARHAESSV
jgi:hypothetical protein